MKGKTFFKEDFLHGPVIWSLDTMIIGHYLGGDSLAAMGACSSIYSLIVGFALGIESGMSIVNARSYGAGDLDKLKQSAGSSICIGLLVALTATFLGRAALRPLLEVLNTPGNIIDEAYAYVSTTVSGALVTLSYNLCSGILRAIGNSFMPLFFDRFFYYKCFP